MTTKLINDVELSTDQLVVVHRGLVYHQANKHKNYAKQQGLDFEDLVSVGFIALLKAYKSFDQSFGWQFATYALPAINNDMLIAIRKTNIGINWSRRVKEVSLDIFRQELGDKSVPEIAKILDKTEYMVRNALEYRRVGMASSLEHPIGNGDDGNEMFIADTVGVEEDTSYLIVTEFLELIPYLEREIIEGLMKGLKQKELGLQIKHSQVNISRTLPKLYAKYKLFLSNDFNKDDMLDTTIREKREELIILRESYSNVELNKENYIELRKQGVRLSNITALFDTNNKRLLELRKSWFFTRKEELV